MTEPRSGRDLLMEARQKVAWVANDEVNRILATGEEVLLVDVREGEEYRAGHLPGAIHVPRGFLEMEVDAKLPDRSAPLVIYCAGGNRSPLSAVTLEGLGYNNIRVLTGGFSAWRGAGLQVVVPKAWTPEQRDRYSRHFVLPDVGLEGQSRIVDGRVLVVGAGGLGSPALYYLAAAGTGLLGIVDFDNVEINNLQRQIIHSTSRVGTNKAESARRTIEDLNPDVEVRVFDEKLGESNVDDIIVDFDVVIDATDNFNTRYLLNDSAVRHGKPYVYGSIFRFEGYASVFWSAKGGPCYRCMHPEAPPEHLAPT